MEKTDSMNVDTCSQIQVNFFTKHKKLVYNSFLTCIDPYVNISPLYCFTKVVCSFVTCELKTQFCACKIYMSTGTT